MRPYRRIFNYFKAHPNYQNEDAPLMNRTRCQSALNSIIAHLSCNSCSLSFPLILRVILKPFVLKTIASPHYTIASPHYTIASPHYTKLTRLTSNSNASKYSRKEKEVIFSQNLYKNIH